MTLRRKIAINVKYVQLLEGGKTCLVSMQKHMLESTHKQVVELKFSRRKKDLIFSFIIVSIHLHLKYRTAEDCFCYTSIIR